MVFGFCLFSIDLKSAHCAWKEHRMSISCRIPMIYTLIHPQFH